MSFSPVRYFKWHILKLVLLYFCLYGFTDEWRLKAMTLPLYLAIALESKDFNTTQTWVGMILNMPYVFSADIYFLWVVDARNMKKMENWGDFGNF